MQVSANMINMQKWLSWQIDSAIRRANHRSQEVFMRHCLHMVPALLCCLALFGCGNATKVGEITVSYDEDADFSQFQTFTVLTRELVPDAREPDEEEELFDELVNDLIIEAMTSEPVCMTFIPPEEVTEENEPDLFAGNGLSRRTEEGTTWKCVGGWWWERWGAFWDPCAWLVAVPIEFEVGSLLIPVGPRPKEGEEPAPVFTGLGEAVLSSQSNVERKVRIAVEAIFDQWPEQRTCSTNP